MTTWLRCIQVWLLLMATLPIAAQVEIEKESGARFEVLVDGHPFTTFYFGPEFPKPFFTPLRAASGQIVTRRFPFEKPAGETTDHQHHRGLFIGYGSISGVNFWENEFSYPAQNKGVIVTKRVLEAEGGKKSGRLVAEMDWQGPDKKVILQERQTVVVYAGMSDLRVMDFDFTLRARENADFADTKEGFFAIRLADSMTEKNGGVMTNSEGAHTEKNVWGKPATWVDYSGAVEGNKLGVAIFDHPSNLRHPERWHTRGYGLFAVNPFGLKDFDPNASTRGGYQLPAGKKLRFRYRVVIHPGDLTKHEIDKLYAAYLKQ